ncbi:cd7 antigen-like [Genypterus blacodes]|uniref:cd7 antigen-like n=1 Tax=Genypterus blacodes TaxID=154954 RepID=UPI003F769E4B
MKRIQLLVCLCTIFITKSKLVCCDIRFLERHEGDSVVFPCVAEQSGRSPVGVYLKRSWLHSAQVLFMYTNTQFTSDEEERITVSGDPSSHLLNVSLSQLRASDTDRYYCEFLVENHSSVDEVVPGKTEFFLYVAPDARASVDIVQIEACAGGSAVLPCLPPNGESSAVEGVSLKRQKGQTPVEVLYSLKHQGGTSSPAYPSSFPLERVQLTMVPGLSSITYSLTLLQLQPEDSALYSCQLLLPDRPDSRSSLGRRVFLVSVQGGQCGCSNYTTLLYALTGAVGFLFIILLVVVIMYQGKTRQSVKPQLQPPIYEEMVGVQPLRRKLVPGHLEEMDASEYNNCLAKKSCQENHYESPTIARTQANVDK